MNLRLPLMLTLTLACGLLSACSQLPVTDTAIDTARAPLESLAALDRSTPARRSLDIQHWNTAEGARVLFVEARQLPMFDLRLTFAAGSSQDADQPGLASLTNAMLNEGSGNLDANAIAEGFERLGADFGNGAYRDMAVLSLRSLSAAEQREPALQLFGQLLSQPSFPEDALQRLKEQLHASFEHKKKNPASLASEALFEQLYGNHPYAHPSDGNDASLARIGRSQLRAFHQRHYRPANLVIALVGDLSRVQAEQIAARLSASLPQGPAGAPLPAVREPRAGHHPIDFPSAQSHLLLAQLGIQRNDPDYAALTLGNQILGGGGFGTRLMEELREKRGLTYGVYSSFSGMQARGPFIISLQTRAEQSDGSLQLVQNILRDYLAQGPTQHELDTAKRELLGSLPLSTASNAGIVGQLGAMGFYQLPLSYMDDLLIELQALTVEQVQAALKRHLDADRLVIVSVGPKVAQQPLPEASPTSATPAEAR